MPPNVSIADIDQLRGRLMSTHGLTEEAANDMIQADLLPTLQADKMTTESTTTPMTPVSASESAFDEARSAYEYEVAKRAHEEELAKGGAIRREPYKSTGTGAVIGAVTGAVATGLTPLGPVPGAIGGAVVGEVAEQAITGNVTPGESAANIAEQAGMAGLAEVGGLAFRTVRPVRYIEPRPLTPDQIARKDTFERYHIPYLPHEVTDSGFHKFLADLGESGVLNPNAYTKLHTDQNALRKEAINGIADQVGTNVPPNQLAQSVVNVIHDSREAMERGIDVLYNTIREDLKYTKTTQQVPTGRMIPSKSGLVGPGTEVPELVTKETLSGGRWADISKTKDAFQAAKTSYEDAAAHLNQPDMLKAPWYQTVTRADALPDQAQWNDAHLFLKEVRAEIRRVQEAKAAGSDTATMADLGVLRKIEGTLEGDLQQALATSPDPKHQQALATWTTAQQNVKEMSETYRNDTILSFVRKVDQHGGTPAMKELILSLSPEDTQKLMVAVKGDPGLQNSIRRNFIETGIERAGGKPGDENVFDPKKARNFIFGKDQFTSGKPDLLIPKATQNDISTFLDATQKQIESQKQGKTGAVFMAMKQSGAVFMIPATALGVMGFSSVRDLDIGEAAAEAGGALTLLMSPTWIANALQNPRTANMLIQGMRYSYSQSAVGKVTQQLFRADEAFARAVQVAAHASGVFHPSDTKATPPPGTYSQPPTAFPLEK